RLRRARCGPRPPSALSLQSISEQPDNEMAGLSRSSLGARREIKDVVPADYQLGVAAADPHGPLNRDGSRTWAHPFGPKRHRYGPDASLLPLPDSLFSR